jgi:hypothetical protein
MITPLLMAIAVIPLGIFLGEYLYRRFDRAF